MNNKTTPSALFPSDKSAGGDAIRHPDQIMTAFPFNYGWVILAGGILGRIMTIPGQTVGISSFLDPMIQDLGLQRSLVSTLFAVGTLVASFSMPFVGKFVDRRGPRLSVILISMGLCLACACMSFANGIVTLLIGILLIRGLGQGAMNLVSLHVINLWFVNRRGLAIASAGIGFAVGSAFFPVLIAWIIDVFDNWRIAYRVLAVIVALSILPIGALFFRDRPEVYGLIPDAVSSDQKAKPISERNLTLAQARRTYAFWLFVVSDLLVVSLGTALLFHHYKILEEAGVGRDIASIMFLPLGIVTGAASFVAGYGMDKSEPKYLLSLMMVFLSLFMATGTLVSSLPMVILYSVLAGTVMGMRGVVEGGIYAYYFGRLELGAIKGYTTTISVAGTAVGPVIISLGRDFFDSFTPVLWIVSVFPLIVAVLAVVIPLPSLRESE